jgi:hypothetical protein
MSDENLELILGGLELWNQRRFEEALELVHPDLEWRPGGLPDLGGGNGRGRAASRDLGVAP